MELSKKEWLNEVSFMRPILLVLLVSYHAFAPYVGSWSMPEGINHVEAYRWLGLLSRACRLEGFVFISGYIFTFQILRKNKFGSVRSLVLSKVERLLLPGLFFSILYLMFFVDNISPMGFAYQALNGVGHLWYLPCLFWCFILQYVLTQKQIGLRKMVPILILGAFLSVIPLPLQLNRTLYYAMFFIGGGWTYRYKDKIATFAYKKTLVLSWLLFIVTFVLLNIIITSFEEASMASGSIPFKVLMLGSAALLKAILGWTGIIALYITAVIYCQHYDVGNLIVKIGACGYGVYVFHQFVLVYMYRYTDMPIVLGTWWLPWIAMVITIMVSLILTLVVRSTRFGRQYL